LQQALKALEGWDNYEKWVWPESALEQAKRNTTESLAALRSALAEHTPNGDAEDAARLDWIAIHGSFGVDSVSGLVGGNGQRCVAATRKNIDAARKEGKL
jgi:hypothetical protein